MKFPTTPPPGRRHRTGIQNAALLAELYPLTKSKSHESQLGKGENGEAVLVADKPPRRCRLPTEPGPETDYSPVLTSPIKSPPYNSAGTDSDDNSYKCEFLGFFGVFRLVVGFDWLVLTVFAFITLAMVYITYCLIKLIKLTYDVPMTVIKCVGSISSDILHRQVVFSRPQPTFITKSPIIINEAAISSDFFSITLAPVLLQRLPACRCRSRRAPPLRWCAT